MARINIEDSLFKDGRFLDLCIHYGDRQRALGAIVWAFIVAQKFFLSEESERLIPLNEWKRQKCDDKLIEFGLAETKDKGIYVCGSEDQFAWLLQKQAAGKALSEKKIRALEKARVARWNKLENSLNGSERDQNGSERDLNGSEALTLTPTLPLTHTLTQSLTHSRKEEYISGEVSKKQKADWSQENKKIKESFVEAYRKRYGIDPLTENATFNSQVANLRKRVGTDDAIALVQFYLTHTDSQYLTKTHSFGLCLRDAETLMTQMRKGQAITSRNVKAFEQNIAFKEQWDRLADK